MFVASMTSEEKRNEALKDLGLMKTKIEMALDTFIKHVRRGMTLSPIRRVTITSKNNNVWTITFIATPEAVGVMIYAPVHGHRRNGYIAIPYITSTLVMEYTAHFLQRYNERYLEPSNVRMGKFTALEYFLFNNQSSTLNKNEKGFYMVSDHGYMIAAIPINMMLVHLTFIGNVNLTNKKSTIYSEKMCHLYAACELLNSKEEITPEVLSRIAHKHNAGQDFIDNWNRWTS